MALQSVIGTEFGEVDRPSRGGYTEPGWNKGAFGQDLSGTSNVGFALPPSVLKPYGYGQKNFARNFNDQYEIQVVNPATGQTTSGPLKDIGPGKSTGAGIDMLYGSRAALGLPINFKGPVQYQIVAKGSGGQPLVGAPSLGSGSPVVAGTGTTSVPALAGATTDQKKVASYLPASSAINSQSQQLQAQTQAADEQNRLKAAMYLSNPDLMQNPLSVYYAMLLNRAGAGGGTGVSDLTSSFSKLGQNFLPSGDQNIFRQLTTNFLPSYAPRAQLVTPTT
jgi:hypothetical protein